MIAAILDAILNILISPRVAMHGKQIRNQEGITYQYHTKHFLYTADPRSSPWLPDYKP